MEELYTHSASLKEVCDAVESLGSSAKFIGYKMNMIEMQMDELEGHIAVCIEEKKKKKKMKEVDDYRDEKE